MADKWELFIYYFGTELVNFISANKCKMDYPMNNFIKKEYPDIKLENKRGNYSFLLMRLLHDGWEPFCYADNCISLRKKINT